MKAKLKAKFLQDLNRKKQDEGFTIIELLVVILIIGILSAIAVPSFLSHGSKAKQSEAKHYIGVLNRAQQLHYSQHSEFTTNVDKLSIGINPDTTNYKYEIAGNISGTNALVTNKGTSKEGSLRSYAGVVALLTSTNPHQATILTALCEADVAGTAAVGNGSLITGAVPIASCPTDFSLFQTN